MIAFAGRDSDARQIDVTDAAETVFCRLENRSFPADEFEDDPEWGLVHNVDPRHTVYGTPTDDAGWPTEDPAGQ